MSSTNGRAVRGGWRAGLITAGVMVAAVAGASVPASAGVQRLGAGAPIVLAQAAEQPSQQRSTRISGRGVKGLVKLGIGAVVLVGMGGAWVYRKVTGSDDE